MLVRVIFTTVTVGTILTLGNGCTTQWTRKLIRSTEAFIHAQSMKFMTTIR